jgi:hypothetical protein
MDIEKSLVDRMIAVLRAAEAKARERADVKPSAELVEARDILALLPRPVDPLLIKARKIAIDTCGTGWAKHWGARVANGDFDDSDRVRIALAALRARDAA